MSLKINLTITVALLLTGANYVFSQNCNFAVKDGSKLTMNFQSWTNPSLYDPKFKKLKEEKQTEAIINYNNSVASGKIQPASNSPMTFTIHKTTLPDGGVEYKYITTIAGKEYSGYSLCKDDTVNIYRNKEIVDIPDGKGGSLGFMIQGPQKLPLKLNVGTKIPVFDDISFLYPTTYDRTVQVVGVSVGTSTSRGVWTSLDVKVRQTVTFSSHTIHYMFAEVTGEEKITINGIEYKAYIIESQTWAKSNMTTTYQSDDEDVAKQLNKSTAKGTEKFNKMMVKKQLTNELGYMVSYLKEWYVPEVGGIVKSENYDFLGGIAGGMTTTAIE